jgi:hypothetical protein
MAGYHIAEIPRGEYWKSSKSLEEVLELQDAETQGVRIMALVEASDIYGALILWCRENGTNMGELAAMSNVTERAFKDGSRKPR